MNQEQARQLAQRIEGWVIKLGGEVLPPGHFFTWRVMTYLGPLGIHRPSESRRDVWIFDRWENPKRARPLTQCNPYTGKWNHYWTGQATPEEVADDYAQRVHQFCIMPPTLPIGLLWTRFGDHSDYNDHAELDNVAETLHELGVGQVTGHSGRSLFAPGFEGANYISLFWGDGDAQIIRDTTWAERAYVIDCLARLQQGVMV
jgi:hypothetical protein